MSDKLPRKRKLRTLVAEHTYPGNGARVAVYAVRGQRGQPAEDTLELRIEPGVAAFFLRPDEALLIIQLLAQAVDVTTKRYEFGLPRRTRRST